MIDLSLNIYPLRSKLHLPMRCASASRISSVANHPPGIVGKQVKRRSLLYALFIQGTNLFTGHLSAVQA
ncbi:MAG TPA: hypothetical protein VGO47_15240 [Chlamydiales bacterium]|nr:hypothetical protein [Chlamydiales bacterium]